MTNIAEPFIVKVQITNIGNNETRMLVYNKARNMTLEIPAPKSLRRQFGYKGGQFKQFYYATLKDGRFQIDPSNKAPWQDW